MYSTDANMDEDKTREQLIEELAHVRRRLAEFEAGYACTYESIQQSEDRYRALFEESRDVIYISSREGLILEINKAASELFGYAWDELLGMDIHELYADSADRDKFQREIEEKGSLKDYEMRLRRKNGTDIYCLITSTVRHDREGAILGYQGIIHDITGRKQAEEEIRKLNRELEQRILELTETNRELDAFSHSVSHDLRAPLVAIGGFARRLLRKHSDDLDAAGLDMLNTILANVQNMERLINDLLAFSRSGRQRMNLLDVDMEELVSTVFEELRTIVPGRKVHLKAGKLLPAYADPSLIRQVIMNLLSNAFKFTRTREEAVIEAGSRYDGNDVLYYVKDNGVGFDMRYANRLFDVFQRMHGDEGFEGTGIGLSIVQRIVVRHGGRVWAEGSVGKGAVFYFTLPQKRQGD
ncbi:MAG: PAS domain S-box protein [Nitrospirae bacterium]|nr:PAS domain S-box protein [Nitrospirota bacterium]